MDHRGFGRREFDRRGFSMLAPLSVGAYLLLVRLVVDRQVEKDHHIVEKLQMTSRREVSLPLG